MRNCEGREYAEVSPLVQIEPDWIQDIQKGRRPRYAYLPGLADRNLVVDLDRTMTVEKAVVANGLEFQDARRMMRGWPLLKLLRVSGYALLFQMGSTPASRNFGHVSSVMKARQQMKVSLLRLWTKFEFNQAHIGMRTKITVLFWFLLEAGTAIDFDASRKVIDKWISLTDFTSPFALAHTAFNLVEPRDMTVQDYKNSYRLDYDDVSL